MIFALSLKQSRLKEPTDNATATIAAYSSKSKKAVTVTACQHKKIAIIAAEFHNDITAGLLSAALETLHAAGVAKGCIRIIKVPGAFELPLAALRIIECWHPAAVITFGAVIRGDTSHFDYVCSGCTQGLQQVSLTTNTPVLFGVLTTENRHQAESRAGLHLPAGSNKGAEVALAALQMIDVLRSI